ncbi:MAG: molybdenum cofactor guanylyltransferase [Thermoplasmata archaeon]
MVQVSGLVLAGGRGERFGSYKATLPLGGEPLILRPLRVLSDVCEEVLIAHGGEEGRRELERLDTQAILVADEGVGPLGGLLAGLKAARGEWVLVAPCDAPFVSRDLYLELLSRARGWEGSVPRLHGRENPVIAAYRRSAFLRAGSEARAEGKEALMEVLPSLKLRYVEEEVLRGMPYGLHCLLDVDTREDYERAQRLLRDPSIR